MPRAGSSHSRAERCAGERRLRSGPARPATPAGGSGRRRRHRGRGGDRRRGDQAVGSGTLTARVAGAGRRGGRPKPDRDPGPDSRSNGRHPGAVGESPGWPDVASAITTHDAWGVRAITVDQRLYRLAAGSPYHELWSPATPSAGEDTATVGRSADPVSMLGFTSPRAEKPRDVRIWRVHLQDSLEWIDAAPIASQPAEASLLFVRPRTDRAALAPWDPGRYRVDLVVADGIHRLSVLVPDTHGVVPPLDTWTPARPTSTLLSWGEVASAITSHDSWGVRVVTVDQRGFNPATGPSSFHELWSAATPIDGVQTAIVGTYVDPLSLLGITVPQATGARAVRIWRVHRDDQLEWVDAVPLAAQPSDAATLFIRPGRGRRGADAVAARPVSRRRPRLGRHPPPGGPRAGPVRGRPAAGHPGAGTPTIAARASDPSGVRIGLFATVDGVGVSLPARETRPLDDDAAWRDLSDGANRRRGDGVPAARQRVGSHADIARGRLLGDDPTARAGGPVRRPGGHRRDLRKPGSDAVRAVHPGRRDDMGAGCLCHLRRLVRRGRALTKAPGTSSSGRAPDRSRPRLSCGHAAPALAQGPARGAALPSRRRRDAGDHVGHRPLAGDQAPDQGLLGVPRHDHGLAAAEPLVRRLPPAVPLDRAHPELAARGRAVRLRGRRRRLPQEQRHDDGAPLQPDEAEPRWRAGPRPHHRGRRAGHGQGEPRVPGQAGPHLLPRPRLPVRAQRDHRREGDRLARSRRRRGRHRRPRIGDLPGGRLPPALPPGAPVRARPDRPHRRVRPGRGGRPGRRAARAGPASAMASRRPTTRGRWR